MNEYVERAQQYMRDVLSGAIPTCKWTRLAVQRQADDLLPVRLRHANLYGIRLN